MAVKKESRVSATEARVHFGEIMRRAEQGETLVVERAGQATTVIISFKEYRRLHRGVAEADPLEERLRKTRERYLQEAQDVHYDVEEDIRQMREERAHELDDNLR
jgi:prevent-host-death family protein